MEKIDFRSLPEEERYIISKTAIKLISKGKKKKDIAALFGVRPTSFSDWVKKQEQQIQNMIIDKMPDPLKLDFALWTRKALKELNRTRVWYRNRYYYNGRLSTQVGLQSTETKEKSL